MPGGDDDAQDMACNMARPARGGDAPRRDRRRLGAELSERHDQDSGRLSARRHDRHHRARRRPGAGEGLAPDRDRREPRRRQRRARGGATGQAAARRPDADDDRVRPHHQSAGVAERGLRRAQGFHRHQPAGVVAAPDLRASGLSGQRHQGRDRARQGKAQHHRLRDAGRGLDPAAFDGAAVLSQRRQVPPRAVPRRRAGA